jgi:NitT/TauT family transport system permease protein
MPLPTRIFRTAQPLERRLQWGDGVVLLGVAVFLYAGVALARMAPPAWRGPELSLAPGALPAYAALSLGRMSAAYALSLLVALLYGRAAARHRRAEHLLLPLLDVLQSVPVLSFLPIFLLSLRAVLAERLAAELAAIGLIFTSQAWNLIFAWYQALKTLPHELGDACAVFRFNGWLRFRVLELPCAAIGLVWNSIMSWAGGWFFLMAAEMFTVGGRDFRLPGLGAYLQEAANRGDVHALAWGLAALAAVIVALDQLVWRPLLAWSSRFKLDMVSDDGPPSSWCYRVLQHSQLLRGGRQALRRALGPIDRRLLKRSPRLETDATAPRWQGWTMALLGGVILLYGASQATAMLLRVPPAQWRDIALGVVATALRVAVALSVALAWTLPAGVAIGRRPQLAARVQPLVQIAASLPATALFPVIVLALARVPGGMELAAVLLMLTGTQWYVLFNVIAGSSAIPQELRHTAGLLQLGPWQRWRVLWLPALFPYLVTGAITAAGGAWNASVVAEYVEFAGARQQVVGIGALISQATAAGLYPLLLAATLAMIGTVVAINRLLWRRLYRLAAARYRLE